MKVLKQIFNSGENAFYKHIAIFSLSGIMTIALNNVVSDSLGGWYGSYFGYAPASDIELYLDVVVAISIALFFCGYFSEAVNYDKEGIPDIHLSCFRTFVKSSPMYLYLGGFLWIIQCIIMSFFENYCFLFLFIIAYLIPWFNIIPILFGQEYKNRKEFFNLFYIAKLVLKNLPKIVLYSIQTMIISIVPFVITLLIFIKSNLSLYSNTSLALRILGISFWGYSFLVLYIAYLRTLSQNFIFPPTKEAKVSL